MINDKNIITGNISNTKYEQLLSNNIIRFKKYSKGNFIHMENDLCTLLEIIIEGNVSIDRIDEEGNVMCIAKFTKNDILGGNLLFSRTPAYPMSIIANTDVTMLQIKKDDLFNLMCHYPDFLKAYLENISDNAFILGDRIRGYVKTTLRQILTNYLKKQSNIQKSNTIKLNMTKKELALLLGVQRTSLSRELAKMRNDKLITFNKNEIKIINFEKDYWHMSLMMYTNNIWHMSVMKQEVIEMPRFDGTGPMGMGPMTGRGLGYCTGVRRPLGAGYGGGFYGRGRGGGFGYKRGFFGYSRPVYYDNPQYVEKPSKELLLDQKKYLEEELASINKQIDELK